MEGEGGREGTWRVRVGGKEHGGWEGRRTYELLPV